MTDSIADTGGASNVTPITPPQAMPDLEIDEMAAITFKSCNVKMTTTKEDWVAAAKNEYTTAYFATATLNMSDTDMYDAWKDKPDQAFVALGELIDHCLAQKQCYEAGVNSMDAAIIRCMVTLARLAGPDDGGKDPMPAPYVSVFEELRAKQAA
jgi:hypothetical protein